MLVDHQVASRLDNRTEHVLHPRIIRRQAADRLVRGEHRSAEMMREQPVRVDQFGRLAADQADSADRAGMFGGDNLMVDRHQVDDFAEDIANFVLAIAQAEHADLIVVGAE